MVVEKGPGPDGSEIDLSPLAEMPSVRRRLKEALIASKGQLGRMELRGILREEQVSYLKAGGFEKKAADLGRIISLLEEEGKEEEGKVGISDILAAAGVKMEKEREGRGVLGRIGGFLGGLGGR